MLRPTLGPTSIVALLFSLGACAPDRGFADNAVMSGDARTSFPDATRASAQDAGASTDSYRALDDAGATADAHDGGVSTTVDARVAPDAGVAPDAATRDAAVSAGTCACDPVGQTGCAAGLACYIVNIEFEYVGTVCATPGTGAMYSSCANPSDCAPGLGCVGETPSIGFSGMCYGMCNPGAGVPSLCSRVGRDLCNTQLHASPCVGVCDADISGS